MKSRLQERFEEVMARVRRPVIGEAGQPPKFGYQYDEQGKPILDSNGYPYYFCGEHVLKGYLGYADDKYKREFENRGEQVIFYTTSGSTGYGSTGGSKYFDISGAGISEDEYNRIIVQLGLEDARDLLEDPKRW